MRSLQYCLETFEATCQCGRCDPCTKGQDDIRGAISALEELGRSQSDAVGHRGGCGPEMNEHSPSSSQIHLTSSFAGDGAAR